MPSYLITGVSRGIGFAFLKKVSADPSNVVVGLVRNKAATDAKVRQELGDRSNIHIVEADLQSYKSLQQSVAQVSPLVNGVVDYLIGNAGYISSKSIYKTFGDMKDDPQALEDDLLTCFRTNCVGYVHLFNMYLPLVLKSSIKKVIVLSSGFADDVLTSTYAIDVSGPYSASKAAVNTVVAKFHAEYASQGVLFMAVAPGTVDVGQNDNLSEDEMKKLMELGGKFAKYAPHFTGPTQPDEAAGQILDVVERASLEAGSGGSFVSQFGNKQWL